MRIRSVQLFIWLCALALSLLAEPPMFYPIDLQGRITSDAVALDINNRSEVVGYCYVDASGVSLRRGFVWRRGSMRILPPLVPGGECIAEAINDNGVIAGYAYTDTDTGQDTRRVFHACMWDTTQAISDLGTMGGYRSVAFDINDSGQVAGFFCTLDDYEYFEHIYVWKDGDWVELAVPADFPPVAVDVYQNCKFERNDVISDPSSLASSWAVANEITINNSGAVATGWGSNDARCFAALWHDSTCVDLNSFFSAVENSQFFPTDVNDSLAISGTRITPTISFLGPSFLWHDVILRDSTVRDLFKTSELYQYSVTLNNKGDLVGCAVDVTPPTSGPFAVIWINDTLYALADYLISDHPLYPEGAVAINDSGVIVCQAYGDGNGRRAFLLVPESQRIVMPARGRFTVTLTKASAERVSDIYLTSPDHVLLIENNLKNVGATVDKEYDAGTPLEFTIVVHPPDNGPTYEHSSNSHYARINHINDSLMEISFEDLPDSIADWDYNDAVLRVELELLEPVTAFRPSAAQLRPRPLLSSCVNGILARGGAADTRIRLYSVTGRRLATIWVGKTASALAAPGRGVYVVETDDAGRISRTKLTHVGGPR